MQLADGVSASPENVTHFHIRKFAAQLHSQGLNPRSIARKLSAWRGFFNWLSEQMPLAANPVDGVKAPKRTKPLPKALSADDAVRLVSEKADNEESATQLCNRAMFELLYSSGLRVSELAGLDVNYAREDSHQSQGWIDLKECSVTVTGKGSKMRSVPVGGPAMVAVAAWLAVRGTVVKADPHPLFLSKRGTRISPRVIQKRLKSHALKLGIPADVHPHMLRHSFASHVLQSSGDLRAVQEMLGHSSITATQIYTSLDFQRLAQVYDAAHPRAKKK
jgi:integrase/recombinase XerC